MICLKKLVSIARKWQKMAGTGRKTIAPPRDQCETTTTAKGHFVVYTTDKRRFVFPLEYLRTNIFQELFRLSEEEFGLPVDGPITLPCDGASLEEVVSFVHGSLPEELNKMFFFSLEDQFFVYNYSM